MIDWKKEPSRATLLRLIDDLVDPGKCWFDHHGGCQEHGYSLERGETCPHAEAKQILMEAGIIA